MKSRPTAIAGTLALLASLFASGCEDSPNPMPLHPQIIPHVNPINFCQVEVPAAGVPRQLSFDLMLVNGGQERLEISKVDVASDQRCAFTDVDPHHYGDVRLFDDDPDDGFLATAKSREAAFMRIRYSPPGVGEDEITITIHSNAENYPEPDGVDVFVCAGGTDTPPLSCRIRMDPTCDDSAANAYRCEPGPESEVATPCPSSCETSGAECRPPTVADPLGEPCADGSRCMSPYYCIADDGTCRDSGAACNPSDAPPCAGTCRDSEAACDHSTPCPGGDECESTDYCVVHGTCRDGGARCSVNDTSEPCTGEDNQCVTQGTCYCRPCAVPPDEGWDDCAST
jgi:hypothetical protein